MGNFSFTVCHFSLVMTKSSRGWSIDSTMPSRFVKQKLLPCLFFFVSIIFFIRKWTIHYHQSHVLNGTFYQLHGPMYISSQPNYSCPYFKLLPENDKVFYKKCHQCAVVSNSGRLLKSGVRINFCKFLIANFLWCVKTSVKLNASSGFLSIACKGSARNCHLDCVVGAYIGIIIKWFIVSTVLKAEIWCFRWEIQLRWSCFYGLQSSKSSVSFCLVELDPQG